MFLPASEHRLQQPNDRSKHAVLISPLGRYKALYIAEVCLATWGPEVAILDCPTNIAIAYLFNH